MQPADPTWWDEFSRQLIELLGRSGALPWWGLILLGVLLVGAKLAWPSVWPILARTFKPGPPPPPQPEPDVGGPAKPDADPWPTEPPPDKWPEG